MACLTFPEEPHKPEKGTAKGPAGRAKLQLYLNFPQPGSGEDRQGSLLCAMAEGRERQL
jgi:hypothetical protein